MPVLNYYDPATQTYKPVVGGMTQDSADARYLLPGRRNAVRNGDFSVYQRGASFSGFGGYTLDGWLTSGVGGSISVSRTSDNDASGYMVVTTSGQVLAGHFARMQFPIEDVRTFAGRQVTLSFSAKAASGSPNVSWEVEQNFGTGGSNSPVSGQWAGTRSLTTTMTRYSITFVVPSITGKTLGTNNNSFLAPSMWVSAGSDWNNRAPLMTVQNNTFTVTDVQLELGPVATPFERLSVQEQLSWCQRYFYRHGTSNPSVPFTSGNYFKFSPLAYMVDPSTAYAWLYLPVDMRVPPSLALGGPVANYYMSSGSTPYYPTGVALDISASAFVSLRITGSGFLANTPVIFQQNGASTPAYFDISAEF